jgi:hypothetical protein
MAVEFGVREIRSPTLEYRLRQKRNEAMKSTTCGPCHATVTTAAMTDEELLEEYRLTGNEDYFAQLANRYQRVLLAYLRRFLRDPEMAEDVLQSTLLQVHLKCDQFQPGKKGPALAIPNCA